MADYRITQFPERTEVDSTDFVLMDSDNNGTNKFALVRMREAFNTAIDTETQARAAADEDMHGSIEQLETDMETALNTKADKNGTYPSMAVGSLLGDSVEDKVPYLFRPTGGGLSVGDREYDEIVGGTLGWNQLCNGSSVTVANGRKYLSKIGGTWSIGASTGSAITGLTAGSDMLIDLTALFGPTIADYIYSLEQATAGSGVAWFRQYFGKDYYPYSAPTLKSVEGLTAHVMRDADNNIVGNYPLDSTWTGMGIPKLVDGKLTFDGDIYPPSGQCTNRFGLVDLGTLNWNYVSTQQRFYSTDLPNGKSPTSYGTMANIICAKYQTVDFNTITDGNHDKVVAMVTTAQNVVSVRDTAYADAASLKTAMSGVMLVYELATPTEETATPYEEAQICDPNGTEEYVTENIVPVGHITQYPENLATKIASLPALPTTAGTYRLKVTVTAGKASYEWVSA